jgi:hypothetical protein
MDGVTGTHGNPRTNAWSQCNGITNPAATDFSGLGYLYNGMAPVYRGIVRCMSLQWLPTWVLLIAGTGAMALPACQGYRVLTHVHGDTLAEVQAYLAASADDPTLAIAAHPVDEIETAAGYGRAQVSLRWASCLASGSGR